MKKQYLLSLSFVILTKLMNAQICQVFITHVINGNTVQYSGSSPDNPTNWSWFFNGGSPLTSSQQNVTVTYSAAGTYISALSVFGGPNSCSASLSSKTDTVTIGTVSIEETSTLDDIHMTSTGGHPVFEIKSSKTKSVTVQLYSSDGKLIENIFTGKLLEGTNTLNMQAYGLATGNYILTIIDENKISQSRKFFWTGN
jgi:PKD repeat protein